MHGADRSRNCCPPKLQHRRAPGTLSVPWPISRGDINIPGAVGHRTGPAHPYPTSTGEAALSVQFRAGIEHPHLSERRSLVCQQPSAMATAEADVYIAVGEQQCSAL